MSSRSAGQRRRPSEAPKPANGRERANSRGEATRQLILLKAEELFAERGIEAVPLRDIGVAAGQKNNVAVQYHFRDRETLVREITSFRAHVGEGIRAELLADFVHSGRSPQIRDLVDIFVQSLAIHLEDGNHYLAFLARYTIERGGYSGLEGTTGDGTIYTLMTILRRLLPDHPEAVLTERWILMNTSAVHTMARYQTAMRDRRLPALLPDLLLDLIAFLSAGLAAPWTGSPA